MVPETGTRHLASMPAEAEQTLLERILDGVERFGNKMPHTIFFVAWYLIGIPLGPGSPVHL